MANNRKGMEGWFGTENIKTALPGVVPMNANALGFVIQDNRLKRQKKDKIPFQYIEQVPLWSKASNFDDVQTLGRFESQSIYGSSSAQDLSIVLHFYADGSEENQNRSNSEGTVNKTNIPKVQWTIEEIERLIARLKALQFPLYDRKYSPPYKCLLNVGSIWIDFPVVIKNVSVQSLAPFRISDLKPFRYVVNVEMRSAYPQYQAISAYDIVQFENGNKIFAQKKFSAVGSSITGV